MTTDLVIIGNSLTGLFAAVVAARSGLSVRLVGEGTGLIHLSSGCIDILGIIPGDPDRIVDNPLATLPDFLSGSPHHPYAKIGLATLSESIDQFRDISHTCGLHYMGTAEKNRFFITSAGTIKQSCLYPSSFDTPPPDEISTIRFLGIEGIRGFFPALASAVCRKVFPDKRVDYRTIDLFSERDERMTPLGLSLRFMDLDYREYFLGKIMPHLEAGMAVGIPALMSPHAATEIIQRLRKLHDVYLFEMATIPPSLPGYHLGQSLLEYAVSLGVEPFIGGRVTTFKARDRRIESVTIDRPGRDITLTGRSFLLATGSLLGGGLKIADNRIIEPLFQLPLAAPDRSDWFGTSFYRAKHPIRKAGVMVDNDLRPIDADGSMVFDNLCVAGTILAGADMIGERSGGGICLGSALRAVRTVKGGQQ